MRSALSAIFIILFVTLAIEAAPAKKEKKGFRVPFRKRARLQRSIGGYFNDSSVTPEFGRRQTMAVNVTSVTSEFGRRQTMAVRLKNYQDVVWIGSVGVGSPPQQLEVAFDTASGDSWFAHISCGTPCTGGGVMTYDERFSATFHEHDKDFSSHFGGGEVLGTWGSDALVIGDIDNSEVSIPQQDFARVQEVPTLMLEAVASGVVGLGYKMSDDSMIPVIHNMYLQGTVEDKVIACHYVKGKTDQGGEIYFGYVPPQYSDGDIQYTRTVPDPSSGGKTWSIPVQDIQIGDKSLGQSCNAYIDNGSSGIIVSDDAAKSIYDGVEGAELGPEGWVLPGPFPSDLYFIIADTKFTVPASDMVTDNRVGDKFVGAVQGGAPDGLWVIGDAFIKNHVLVFDFSKQAIGIGKRSD